MSDATAANTNANADTAATGKTTAERLGPVQAGLRSDLEVTRHQFRGQPQYIVRDPITFETHQFSQGDYQILVALNDTRRLEEIFQTLVDEGQLAVEQEEEFYHFVLALHRLNYLILPMADGKMLYERFAQRQRTARWRQASSFLFLRVPLINPDAFLDRTADFVRPLFTRVAFVLWAIMMAAGVALLVRRWDSFRDPVHSILANDTLLFLWIALIGLKVVHEFGHAYACKIFGGKVPEMGAYFIVFTPCAYMDASAAWGFAKTRHRVIVSLAGMYFESFVAFLALMVWSWTDDPLLGSCAHHVVVLSSLVTIGFNINPLMRYDGYYVLSDLAGIPNLRQRSIQEVQSLLKRSLLGIAGPVTDARLRERLFLLVYGVASAIYKVTLVLAICTMIALKFYMVGIGLAAFFLFGTLLSLVRRLFHYLWRSHETRPVRYRAVALSLMLLVVLPVGIAFVPVPGAVVVSGVVQTNNDKTVYAGASGNLELSRLGTGSRIQQGETICQLQNVQLESAVARTRAEVVAAQLNCANSVTESPQAATVARLRLEQVEERFDGIARDLARLQIVAPISGLVIRGEALRDSGRFVRKGESVATIAAGDWTVRCLATAEQIADVRPTEGQGARVRLMLDGVHEVTGTVEQVAVKGSRKVFSAALTQLGGGEIAVRSSSLVANRPMFEIVVRLNDVDHLPLRYEGLARVSFRCKPQTYGAYAYRRFQQFLNQLRVR